MKGNNQMNAKQALTLHLEKLESLNAQSSDLAAQIAEADQPRADVEALRQQRRKLLGDSYPAAPDKSALAAIDRQIATAEAVLRAASDRAEGAAFAADVLTTKNDALQREIAPLQAQTASMLYAAHVSNATEAAMAYKTACAELAHAHAKLQAACMAADQFAQPSASPARLFTIGSSGVVNSFAVTTPNLPGINIADFAFDMSSEIQAELAKALETVGGLDHVRTATIRQMHDRIDRAAMTMQAQIAALDRAA